MIPKSGHRFSEKRSCSDKKLERDDDSKKSHPAIGVFRLVLIELPTCAPAGLTRGSIWLAMNLSEDDGLSGEAAGVSVWDGGAVVFAHSRRRVARMKRREFITLFGGAAVSVPLAALFSTAAASAQRYRAAPKSYDAVHSRARGQRFTDEEQRIIDAITANGWHNGK